MATKKTAEHEAGDIRAARLLRTLADAGLDGDVAASAWGLIEAIAKREDDWSRAMGASVASLMIEIREMGIAEAARTVANRLHPPRPSLTEEIFGHSG